MPRRFDSPNLHKSKIKILGFLGKGQDHNHSEVHKAKVIEKTHDKKLGFQAVRKYRPMESRRSLASQQSIYRNLKHLGLPVPRFSRTMLETIGFNKRMIIIAENLEKKHGKLYDCHERGNPIFLRKLSIKKDQKLIESLAKDLATMHRAGIIPKHIDFWHFYRTGNWSFFRRGSWDRVIVDFDKMFRIPKKEIEHSEDVERNLKNISHNMSSKTWKEFHKIYIKEMGYLF
ncbi:MAG: lipopolysaccharide kinase InaA family protein [archaeon]|jgi:hypothetical protein